MIERIPLQPVLTFELLDDVLFQPQEEGEKMLLEASIYRIGPLVEYALYLDPIKSKAFLTEKRVDETSALSSILYGKRPRNENTSLSPLDLEFAKVPQRDSDFDSPSWIAFEKRLQTAGAHAGFPKAFAQELAGTFGEMVSNVLGHSESPETGIVGYRWNDREFEYVVADRGIGVLESLRMHEDYKKSIADHEQALITALSEGESRYGRFAKRGNGFNTLVLNIANRNSCLRFRSGDRSHVIDGRNAQPTRATYTCLPYQGFLISVLCFNHS